jgi:phosphohistidine phosphatase SixA
MKLVFVRHGPKIVDDTLEDADRPLDPSASELVGKLADALKRRSLTPRFIVSSRYRHALDTAALLRGPRTRRIIPVTALEPRTPECAFTMSTVIAEAMDAGVDLLRDCDVLMLVGHETRLSQLAARFLAEPTTLEQLSALESLVLDWHAVLEERIAP